MIVKVRRRSGNIEQLIDLDVYNTEEKWLHFNDSEDIMAYRLHKPVEQVEACSKPELRSLQENYGEIIGGSVEGPIQWRDRITEIDATTQALTAERADLVQKLAGEGLPPVGVVCEVKLQEEWSLCEIIAHFQQPQAMVAAFTVAQFHGGKKLDSKIAECFRPIRTPEQIAAYERSKYCDRIYGVMCKAERPCNRSDMAEVLYDAGLRFSE